MLLAAPEQYAGLVSSNGIEIAPLPGEFLALLETPEGRAAIAGSRGGFAAGFKLIKYIRPMMRRLWDTEWEAARGFGPELIVYHPKSLIAPRIGAHLDRSHVVVERHVRRGYQTRPSGRDHAP